MPPTFESPPAIRRRSAGLRWLAPSALLGGCLLAGWVAEAARGADDLAARQLRAFAELARLPDAIEIPTVAGIDLFDGVAARLRPAVIEVGALAVADLVEPAFGLAVSDDTATGRPFEASIVVDKRDPSRWDIRQATGVVGLDGMGGGYRTLATLVAERGRLRLEVSRKEAAERPLASLRRCVILIEAKDPKTGRPLLKELRLVKPTRVGPLVVDPFGGVQALRIPVPAGIAIREAGSEAAGPGRSLPVSRIEVEGRWGDKPVKLRLPNDAATLTAPGVAAWTIDQRLLAKDIRLSLAVTLSLPRAELACSPCLTGPAAAGREVAEFVALARGDSEARTAIQDAFFARVDRCPVKAYGRRTGDLAGNWFEAPLATVPEMGVALEGHETIRGSIDLYLAEEYRKEAARLAERWQEKLAAMPNTLARSREEYFGPDRPQIPAGFDEWRKSWNGTSEEDWTAEFGDRLIAWSVWFWKRVEAEWNEAGGRIDRNLGERVELEVLAIRSIASDRQGREYLVPLVEFDPAARAVTPMQTGEADTDVGHSPRGGETVVGLE